MINLRPLVISCALLGAVASSARAEDCPTDPPTDPAERRALAKQWFSKAETAEHENDDVRAVRAYQCSMGLIPHAFTAYNLARVAEQAGDLQQALDAYQSYLTLKPNAEDGPEVSAHIQILQERLAVLKERQNAEEAKPAPRPTPPPPAPAEITVPTESPPPVHDELRLGLRTTDWAVMGSAAAALVTGGALNLVARSRMSECRDLADKDRLGDALDACHAARPFAYASYALMGAAGAAVIIDLTTVLIWRKERIAVVPVSGGAKLTLRGRF
jgi:tetratricopeptide (TPR) repeat protein